MKCLSRARNLLVNYVFTKSESKIEDLVDMMSTLQDKYTHKYKDGTEIKCYERKVISGDNKTEKNSHHGIIRYTEGSMNELLKLETPVLDLLKLDFLVVSLSVQEKNLKLEKKIEIRNSSLATPGSS